MRSSIDKEIQKMLNVEFQFIPLPAQDPSLLLNKIRDRLSLHSEKLANDWQSFYYTLHYCESPFICSSVNLAFRRDLLFDKHLRPFLAVKTCNLKPVIKPDLSVNPIAL
jgi:hypothetical protein